MFFLNTPVFSNVSNSLETSVSFPDVISRLENEKICVPVRKSKSDRELQKIEINSMKGGVM